MMFVVNTKHQTPTKEQILDAMPAELNNIIEGITALFWNVKAAAEKARGSGGDAPDTDADATERRVHRRLALIGQTLMSEYFEGLRRGDLGYHVQVEGKRYARRHAARENSLLTVFGKVRYQQSLYYGDDGETIRPLQRMANLPERKVSYFAQDLIARLGLRDTFGESRDFYAAFFGHSMSTRTVEQVLGEAVGAHQAYRDAAAEPAPEEHGEIVVASFDGKGVRVVPSERTTGKTREALLGCLYSIDAERRDAAALALSLSLPELLDDEQKENLQRQSRAEDIRYHASLGRDKKELFAEVAADAAERSAQLPGKRLVVLMDGAHCLWSLAKEHFPFAEYILDIIHVRSYLRNAAAALYPKEKTRADTLVCAYLQAILEGKVDAVVRGLGIRLGKRKRIGAQRRSEVERAIGYFRNHRDYMHYDRYLAAGYPIASGVVESACRHIAKDRMDKSGAQWTLRIAEAVLKLRAVNANGHWRQYVQIRQQAERKRLYDWKLPLAA